MVNDQPHDDDEDAVVHLTLIQRLADEFRMSVEQILPLYKQEFMSLRGNARVTTYLSVLTTKHVRAALHEDKRRRQ